MKKEPNKINLNWEKMVIFFEITDFCNAKCIMCGAHTKKKFPHARPKNFITFNNFKKVIDNIASSHLRPKTIVYSWLGESVLHPEFINFLRYADKKGFTNQQFNTNALGLSRSISDELIKIESVRRIHFSLDSSNEKEWKRIKGVKGFKKVVENIDYLVSISNPEKLNLVFAYIIQSAYFRNAKNFIHIFSNMLKKYSRDFIISGDVVHSHKKDVILFSRLLCSNQTKANKLHNKFLSEIKLIDSKLNNSLKPSIDTNQLTVENRFSKDCKIVIGDEKRFPCAALWYMPNIDSNGKLTVCCHDIDLELSLGSILTNSFDELWFGEKIKKFRNFHLASKFDKMKLCSKCGGIEHFKLDN